jgi:hypothetical protein
LANRYWINFDDLGKSRKKNILILQEWSPLTLGGTSPKVEGQQAGQVENPKWRQYCSVNEK